MHDIPQASARSPGLRRFLRDAWRLTTPYFRSDERRSAWGLLLAIVVLNLSMVGMDVVLNFWNGQFYDSLQNRDWDAFIGLLILYHRTSGGLFGVMPGFCVIVVPYILVAIYSTYLRQWLQMRWRRWMTGHFLDQWLADRAYYRLGLGAYGKTDSGLPATDNPDQRIAEDLRFFIGDGSVSGVLSLGLDLLSNIVSLFSFLGILWGLSGPLRVLGITIPAYMVWVAILYAIIGTGLTHLVGRKLARLNFDQQRYEADFRFGLVRVRENAEGIALHGGEAEERGVLLQRFGAVMQNWWGIMSRTKALNALILGYQQIAVIFPFIVAAPRYFAGAIPLGGLTRTSSAFGQVQSALSWFVTAYAQLAVWRATVDRLSSFDRAISQARAAENHLLVQATNDTTWKIDDLSLRLTDGTALLQADGIEFSRGAPILIRGRSGSGKSTLLRALAGIWPFGQGHIRRPAGRVLFLSQRPYLPLGTLRRAIAYPNDPQRFDTSRIEAALHDAGLAGLIPELDVEAAWATRLSGGEQQRLAFARALLLQPDWLFLDEATASLDDESAAELQRVAGEKLPNTTIIAVTHQPATAATGRSLRLDGAPGARRLLLETQS